MTIRFLHHANAQKRALFTDLPGSTFNATKWDMYSEMAKTARGRSMSSLSRGRATSPLRSFSPNRRGRGALSSDK